MDHVSAASLSFKKKLRQWGREKAFPYVLSLPERTLRSASAVSMGLLREIVDVALPIGVRRGRLYQEIVGVTIRFMVENVGRVEGVYTDKSLAEDFIVRRTIGNGVELVGMIAFRASPVWVLAALADVCGWGRQLIPEIADALKAEGLLEKDQSFTNMDQLLDGLERTSSRLAETINMPPLDIAGLRQEWMKLKEEAKLIPAVRLPSPKVVTGLWSDIKDEAGRQQRTVFEMTSVMALSAVSSVPDKARRLTLAALVVGRKSGGMVSNALFDHYRTTLSQIRETGYVRYTSRQLSPYFRAAFSRFSPGEETTTQRLLRKR